MKVDISSIVIGRRFRKQFGNLQPLTDSMQELGQLQPILLGRDNNLIAGQRRLEAAKLLGWQQIEATVIDSFDVVAGLKAERDENACRKDFEPSELVALGRELEKVEREAAKERMREGGKAGRRLQLKGREVGLGDESPKPKPIQVRTRDKIGEALGVCGETYDRAKRIVEAAESDPDKYGYLVEKMDNTSINAAYKELKESQKPKVPQLGKAFTSMQDNWRCFHASWQNASEQERYAFVKGGNPGKRFEKYEEMEEVP